MTAITVNHKEQRAIIRTAHTWYSVSLEWLRANIKSDVLFAEAVRMLLEKKTA